MLPLSKEMENKRASKRKTDELKHLNEPKVRKKENLEFMTKQTIIKKFKELEEEKRNLVISSEKLKEENENLSKRIEIMMKNQSENPKYPSSSVITQTEDLLCEMEYPCTSCIYVADVPEELGWHMQGEHGRGNPDYEFNFSCRICRKPYDLKDDLMYHIKYNHERNMPVCKYFQTGSCHFDDDKCWFRHKKEDQTINNFKCGYCGRSFELKNEFMIHRKNEHNEKIKICINYRNKKCTFDENCWYNHKDEPINFSNLSEY